MASRPCFRPSPHGVGVVTVPSPEFQWYPGFSLAQKQRSIKALHAAVRQLDPQAQVLEISSKSLQEEGVRLGAFNLKLVLGGVTGTVETFFQGSKVFEGGNGPFPNLYPCVSKEESKAAKKFTKEMGEKYHVIGFELQGERWPTTPRTAFYDYLYLTALGQNPDLAEKLMSYDAFTDIVFNPERQINCQAAAAALYVSLRRAGRLEEVLASKDAFIQFRTSSRV